MSQARELEVAGGIALVGWTLCGAVMALTGWAASMPTALAVNSVVAPVFFLVASLAYFRRGSALPSGAAAALFAFVGVVFTLATAVTVPERGMASLQSLTGTWLPLALVLVVTWGVGLASHVPDGRTHPHTEHVEDV